MERGAALYIEKPFTLDYLEACVKSVLEKRRRLKEVWQENAPSADAGSFNLVERDAEFLNKLNKEINERMSDPSFTVQNIEEALFMSRSSLTRKIRGLLAQALWNISGPEDWPRPPRCSPAGSTV